MAAKGKKWYVYQADDGTNYAIFLSKNVDGAQLGFVALASNTVKEIPRRWEPRTIHAVRKGGTGNGTQRRTFPVAKASDAIYKSSTPVTFTYDGIQWETTGRTGESASWPSTFDTGM